MALGFLPETYTLRGAITSINQRYFDGHQILFPGAAEGFDQLLASVEKLVDIYNDALAGEIGRLERLLDEPGDGLDEYLDAIRNHYFLLSSTMAPGTIPKV